MCSSPGMKLCSILCRGQEREGCGGAFSLEDAARRHLSRLGSYGGGLTVRESIEETWVLRYLCIVL